MPDAAPTPPAPAPLLSVCIPAYNRAALLPALLDSIFSQSFDSYEVVICEDVSPERAEIRAVVERYDREHPGRIRYVENPETLGYDGNFREMLAQARGEFCFIMGNDDLVAPGALAAVGRALARHPEVGVVLRSYAHFHKERPGELFTVTRYYKEPLLFPPGPETVVAFYRRLVFMSGLVFRREDSVALATDRFDGTMFYQHHLAARILLRRPGLFLPDVLSWKRVGAPSDFGVSRHERGRFSPGAQRASASARFLRGHLDIIRHVDEAEGTRLLPLVLRDEAQNIYPAFATSYGEGARTYSWLYRELWKLGMWRYPMFHAYAAGVALLGTPRTDALLYALRRRLGYSPSLTPRPRGAVPLEAGAGR